MSNNSNPANDPIKQLVDQWYKEFCPSITKYISWRIGGDTARQGEVEDLSQEVYQRALRNLRGPASNPIHSPKQWLLKIAKNVCSDHLNKNTHFSISYDEQVQVRDSLPGHEIDQPEIQLFGEDTKLMEALNELPPDQRRATYLHYLLNMTYEEISVITGRSPEKEGRNARSGLENLKKIYLRSKETEENI